MNQHTMHDRARDYLSAHGRMRARQRGTRDFMIDTLAAMADQAIPIGRGCMAVGLSRTAAEEARAEGVCPEILHQLRRRAIVVASDGTIVTLVVKQRGRGRHYSRRSRGTARERVRARRR